MKKKRITSMIGILLILSGCTVATATQEASSPTLPLADKEVVSATKDAAEELVSEVRKTGESTVKDLKKEEDNSVAAVQKEPEKKPGDEANQIHPSPTEPPAPDPTPEPKPQPQPTPSPETEPVPQPTPQPKPEPTPIPAPTPAPEPPKACPGGVYEDIPCDSILDSNYYREKFSSYGEALAKGQYYMDEVMYIGDIEITNYSVQEVYRNDHSIAFYGLNLWSNGSLIQ